MRRPDRADDEQVGRRDRVRLPDARSPDELRRTTEPSTAPTANSLERRSVVGLQRAAGNAVVASLVARGAVQRQPTGGRPGELWPSGPVTKRKTANHSVTDYAGWVAEIEVAYGRDMEVALQRLRRLYYSSYSGKAGGKFDAVIRGIPGATAGPPLTAPPLSTDALDGLFETNEITTPSGGRVDVSHLLAGLDIELSGASRKAAMGGSGYGVEWAGVLTWVGDLASWFVEWQDRMRRVEQTHGEIHGTDDVPLPEQISLLNSLVTNKASKEDLLSDIDAQVMALEFVTDRPDMKTMKKLAEPFSVILEKYYDPEPDEIKYEKARFWAILLASKPAIPFARITQAPFFELGAGAEDTVLTAITNTARLFIEEGYAVAGRDSIKRYPHILREIARRFTAFLRTGLAKGDAPWP